MYIDKWVSGYKVEACPWIDHETIYFNVAYYQPGQSLWKHPAWEKTVYITDNANGERLLTDFLHSFVEHVAQMKIADNTRVVITA